MEQKVKDRFIQKLGWQVYNKQLDKIHSFEYSNFKFKCNMTSQEDKKAFVKFMDKSSNNLMPWDVCNFFIKRKIKYSIGFRYIKGASLKDNLTMFKVVLFLKKEKLKLHIKNIKIIPSCKKKMINSRERYDLSFQIIDLLTSHMYFIQCDSNIWWIPEKITEDNEEYQGTSIGWLFIQVGKVKVK